MPLQRGILIGPLHRCDICGCDFRIGELQWQNGLLKCSEDMDNPIMWQRDKIIVEVLGDGRVDADIAEQLKDGGDVDWTENY